MPLHVYISLQCFAFLPTVNAITFGFADTAGSGSVSGATWTKSSGSWTGARGDRVMCNSGDANQYFFSVQIGSGSYPLIGVAPSSCCVGLDVSEGIGFAAIRSVDGNHRGSAVPIEAVSAWPAWNSPIPPIIDVAIFCNSRTFRLSDPANNLFLGQSSWPMHWAGVYAFVGEQSSNSVATLTNFQIVQASQWICATENPNQADNCPECIWGPTCACNGQVKYGYGSQWSTWYPVSHVIECADSVFGDPFPGQGKVCYCEVEKCSAQDNCRQCRDGPFAVPHPTDPLRIVDGGGYCIVNQDGVCVDVYTRGPCSANNNECPPNYSALVEPFYLEPAWYQTCTTGRKIVMGPEGCQDRGSNASGICANWQ